MREQDTSVPAEGHSRIGFLTGSRNFLASVVALRDSKRKSRSALRIVSWQ